MISFATVLAVLSWLFGTTIKASLLILLVAAIQRLAGNRLDARWRHLLWIVVLVRLLMPMAPSSSWSLFNLTAGREIAPVAREVVVTSTAASVAAGESPVRVRTVMPLAVTRWIPVARWIFAVWLAGALILAIRTLVSSVRTQRAVRRALRGGDLRRSLGLDAAIPVVESDVVRTPALHGLLRPVILLPRGLVSSFTEAELRHVILHELWHQRRFDVAVSWLLSAAQTLHWFNPFVWFAASRIKEERELACDELALSCLEEDERPGYGMTILKLLERFRAPAPIPALVGIVNHKQKMKRRLTMIASFRSRARMTAILFLTVAAVGVVGLTDAEAGDGHQKKHLTMMKKIDPAALGTAEKLHGQISFETTGASFGELLTAVSNAAGVVITQSPDVATLPVQQARFTMKADNVPAHLVLMESLRSFHLTATPTAEGILIEKADEDTHMRHAQVMVMHGEQEDETVTSEDGEVTKKIVRMRHECGEDCKHDHEAMAKSMAKHEGMAKHQVTIEAEAQRDDAADDGHVRGEFNLKFDKDGQQSTGTLTFDIETK